MDHEHASSLLGAWALDALEEAEAAAVEAHLAICERCAAEAQELTEVAGALASTSHERPPELWDAIAAHLAPPGAGSAVGTPILRAPAPRFERRQRVLVGVAMAALVLAGAGLAGVGVLAHDLHAQSLGGRATTVAALAASIEASRSTTVLELTNAHHTPSATLALTPNGTAVLTAIKLPPLASNQTYQVWAITPHGAVSIALLGSHPTLSVLRAPTHGVEAIAITAEPATGTTVPTSAPLAQVQLA